MRGLGAMLYETSKLDPLEGIRYRGKTLDEIMDLAPKFVKDGVAAPEAVLWLLLTGEYPNKEQLDAFVGEMSERGKLPAHVESMIDNFPAEMHPMSQFSAGVLGCQTESEFAAAYRGGIHRSKYWEPAFEDGLNVIAKTKRIAAKIYHNLYNEGAMPDSTPGKDFGGDFANMMGFNGEPVEELIRLYLTVHMDHEGGNVSAHANRLVASALSDPYLSFSASMNGLAGPLHGLANQECLRWLLEIREKHGSKWNKQSVADHVWDTLNSGKVVPGYGHAVLRKTDPRFTLQLEFAEKNFPEDDLVQLVRTA